MVRTALISGIGGQDGGYLTELLLDKGYAVHGFDINAAALDRLTARFLDRPLHVRLADVTDPAAMSEIVGETAPAEIYNLAAEARVDVSFRKPLTAVSSVAMGATILLEAARELRPGCRFYQASSSEMFGSAPGPQSEDTPFAPVSPYGCAKLMAHHLVATYRRAYGMFACSGILFNHESERRNEHYVSRKISAGVADIVAGRRNELVLGNLDARRDWGHARDYVRAMWQIVQHGEPSDYVIATGVSRSVADFAALAFGLVGLDWKQYVVSDPAYCRPTDPADLAGDASRARAEIGWAPETSFEQLVHGMLAADLRLRGIRLDALQTVPF